jgi:heme-degrading monooxygenase HmoA
MSQTAEAYRVTVRMHIHPGMEQEFEKTWKDVASGVARHPANRGQWLTRSPEETGVYAVVSDWVSEERFREFERSPEHAVNRMRLDPYRDRSHASMTPDTVLAEVRPPAQAGRVRVVLYLTEPESEPGVIERCYHQISQALVGRPGLRGNELLRSVLDPRRYVVQSEWDDAVVWREWEASQEHRELAAPLLPYLEAESGSTFGAYEIVAAY